MQYKPYQVLQITTLLRLPIYTLNVKVTGTYTKQHIYEASSLNCGHLNPCIKLKLIAEPHTLENLVTHRCQKF